jgi:hypothetical protein
MPDRRWFLRAVLSVGAVGFLLTRVDLTELGARLKDASPSLVGLAFAALLLSAVAGGLVWASVFPRDHALPSAYAIRCTLVGFSINNVVPTGVAGDVYRAWVVARRSGGWPLGCYSVLMDRWCAFLVLLAALGGAALWLAFAAPLGETLRALDLVVVLMAGGFLGATILLLMWNGRLPPILGLRVPGLEQWMPDVAARMWAHVASRRVAATLLWAALSMTLEAASILFAARALGASGSPWTYLILAPVFRVMHRVPGFVNAIGPQEVAAVALWGTLGVGAALALSISFVIHALRVAVGLVGVPFYLADRDQGSQ